MRSLKTGIVVLMSLSFLAPAMAQDQPTLPADAPVVDKPLPAPVAPAPAPTPAPAKPDYRDPSVASVGRFAVGVAGETNVKTGVNTISPSVTLTITGQKLPSQDSSILASRYHFHLTTDPYKVSSLATSEDEKGMPLGVDLHLEGAVGAGVPTRPCGAALLALLGLRVRGQSPLSSLGEGSFVGSHARADVDAGAQLNVTCMINGTALSAGPKAIATAGAAGGPEYRGYYAIKDPAVLFGANVTVIRDGDYLIEAEFLKNIHQFGILPTPGTDSRVSVAFSKKIIGILAAGVEASAEDFTNDGFTVIQGRATVGLGW